MALKVAFPFRHHAALICPEAKQMLLDAGFELVCNDTGEKLSAQEQLDMIRDAYAVIAGTETYDAQMLQQCPELKVVVRFGVGTDNFDLSAMKKQGIQVGVIANYNAVAEFALTLILSVLKNMPRYDAAVRRAAWDRYPMRELRGKTVGIVGFGRIGRRLAELLTVFDVELLVYDPFITEETAQAYGVRKAALNTLLSSADIVSLHLPATKETFHMMGQEDFARMKQGAYLINTARGALVDEAALVQALESGHLAGAALDVFESEPVAAGNPLYNFGNTVLSPHVSALTYETNYNGGLICANSVLQVHAGGKPVYPLW